MIIASAILFVFLLELSRPFTAPTIHIPWRAMLAGFLSGVVGTVITLSYFGFIK